MMKNTQKFVSLPFAKIVKTKDYPLFIWFPHFSIHQKTFCLNSVLLMVEKSGNQTKLWSLSFWQFWQQMLFITEPRLTYMNQTFIQTSGVSRLCFVHACWHLHFSWNNSHSYFTHRRKIKEVEWWYGGLKGEFISGKFIGLYKSLSVRYLTSCIGVLIFDHHTKMRKRDEFDSQ